ncbi:MAG: UDP-N-acetylmuramate dehydrogenase [Myxococcales bacterium]|nr:UDP-N-acetylmuramate dehydrogenase [Myxococcales bacterium]
MNALDRMADTLAREGLSTSQDAPLAKKTWWRVGGPADLWVEAGDRRGLARVMSLAHEEGVPVFVLGNASNLLVSDKGIRGVVVRLVGELAGAAQVDRTLTLGGGARLVQLLKRAEREGWTGLEMLAGIPGTVGGAVVMNAGTRLGELSDALIDVDLVLADGEHGTATVDDLHMSYRHSELPEGAVVAAARVRLSDEDPAEAFAHVREHLEYRARTQPVDVPTCGSTFRNPEGNTAGRLIESCGLKGTRIGGAQVSEKHANFLVNTGGATATELRDLIDHVRATVAERTGVLLRPEVVLAGEW